MAQYPPRSMSLTEAEAWGRLQMQGAGGLVEEHQQMRSEPSSIARQFDDFAVREAFRQHGPALIRLRCLELAVDAIRGQSGVDDYAMNAVDHLDLARRFYAFVSGEKAGPDAVR